MYRYVGFKVLTEVAMKGANFCGPLGVNGIFEGSITPSSTPKSKPSEKLARMQPFFLLVSCLDYSSILKMGAVLYSYMT
jgi:hypothetical protein